jgi:predicted permease
LNVANLALTRLSLRRKEMATRIALGAGRMQLMRQLILENLGLALMGGLSGIALGAGLLRTLSLIGLEHMPRAGEVQMDAAVVLVSLGLSVAAGLFVALFPLASVSKIGISDALHEDSRTGTTGKKTRSVRQLLVAAQIGFAFALLMGAALFLASFRRLLQVDPGFRPEGVVTASVSLPRSKYAKREDWRNFLNRALPAVRAIPGVSQAGATNVIPLGGDHNDEVVLAEGYEMKPGESIISPLMMDVTPGYFEAMGISMVQGRSFDERDNETAPRSVIVDERLAKHFWPDRNPVGRRMYLPSDPKNLLKIDEHTIWLTVVGVAHTLRYQSLDDTGASVGAYYLPISQDPDTNLTFAVKATGDSDSVVRALRTEVSRLDPDLAVFNVRSMSERMDLSLAARRTSMLLANAFGGVALFLATLGIYGVLAYLVAQRTREIGIRMALGSPRGSILGLVLREGFKLVLVGLVLGLVGAASMQKAVASEVYGVRPLDPLVLVSVMAVLAIVALAACAVPARRAMRVDPIVALRSE